ncbi:MAG: hypothetical protein KA984_01990 [Candidatus Cloacimonetes bacterium]|nr:hypothetical protein [Candidatus Cloacimonadota bacterium]
MLRCKRCLMPNTLPGSDFDAEGVCSWCRNAYPNYTVKGEERLGNKFRGLRIHQGRADCIVGLSGGKDSTYALYRLVSHYGLKAEAFIYTHRGSRDFALANARRSCQILRVPLHQVFLPRDAHKRSFLQYFRAWLDHPDAISANMTCVACKHLHILGSRIATTARAPYVVWSSTPLEYSPFLALKHKGDAAHPYRREGMLQGALKLVGETFRSPSFRKGLFIYPKLTVLGCAAVFPDSAFLTRRFPNVKPLMFYAYERWNPELILRSISTELDWQSPPDTLEDWHTDCLFNVFKEYMFQKMYGVSYTDAHLSNQIRHNYITREQAIQKLRDSKRYYASSLQPALRELGAEDLMCRIDPECFNVEI